MVDHLIRGGRQRIAGLFGATSATGAQRRDAFEAQMRQHEPEPITTIAAASLDAGRAVLQDVIAAHHAQALILSNELFVGAA